MFHTQFNLFHNISRPAPICSIPHTPPPPPLSSNTIFVRCEFLIHHPLHSLIPPHVNIQGQEYACSNYINRNISYTSNILKSCSIYTHSLSLFTNSNTCFRKKSKIGKASYLEFNSSHLINTFAISVEMNTWP